MRTTTRRLPLITLGWEAWAILVGVLGLVLGVIAFVMGE